MRWEKKKVEFVIDLPKGGQHVYVDGRSVKCPKDFAFKFKNDDDVEIGLLRQEIVSISISNLVEKFSDPATSVSLLLPELLKGKEAKPCPLCKQTVKVYYRSITPAMAYCLIIVYRKTTPGGEMDIPGFFAKNHAVQSDFTKLKYWGLIEQGAEAKAGIWKVSEKGRNFVANKISVQRYAKVYNDTFRGFEGETEDILMCLTDKYNYTHLMTADLKQLDLII